jgi:hypothetical protein
MQRTVHEHNDPVMIDRYAPALPLACDAGVMAATCQ